MTKDDVPRNEGETTAPDLGADVASDRRLPHLIVLVGPNVGDVYPLREGTLIIGRADDADIHLLDLTISRRHAQLTVVGEDVTVRDLNSRNGTGLGIRRLKGSHLLKDGEVLQVGGVTLLKASSVPPLHRRQNFISHDLVHIGIHSPKPALPSRSAPTGVRLREEASVAPVPGLHPAEYKACTFLRQRDGQGSGSDP